MHHLVSLINYSLLVLSFFFHHDHSNIKFAASLFTIGYFLEHLCLETLRERLFIFRFQIPGCSIIEEGIAEVVFRFRHLAHLYICPFDQLMHVFGALVRDLFDEALDELFRIWGLQQDAHDKLDEDKKLVDVLLVN